jgi:hypothetical protein
MARKPPAIASATASASASATDVYATTPCVDQAHDLVRARRQAGAEALCTQALAQPGLAPQQAMQLLELRSDARLAQGLLGPALADADTMLRAARCALRAARRARDTTAQARAQCARALVLGRMGRLPELLTTSAAALKLAQRCGDPSLQALALLRRSDSLHGTQRGSGVAEAQAALDLYARLGDLSGRARAGAALA